MKDFSSIAGWPTVILVFVTGLAASTQSGAQQLGFADMSLAELMDVPVTSVSKKTTKLGDSPAAITVITQDDLRQQGITNLPDALRLVPGIEVSQVNSHEWAVSARGFNGEYGNKLLVLIDGRTVYDSVFGGVDWGLQNLVMEDVDRIEVIRGPGGALWGANAVNGVINIITKPSGETQGGLLSVAAGTTEQPNVASRYGGSLGTDATYRAYVKYNREDGLVTPTGAAAPDAARDMQTGGRTDWAATPDDHLTLQGDYFVDRFAESQLRASLTAPYEMSEIKENRNTGENVLGRWTHQIEDNSSLALQAYVDTFHLMQLDATQTVQTVDFDAQHRFSFWNRNDVVWGLGYRHIGGSFVDSPFVSWSPERYTEQLYNVFVQDEISLVPERASITVGSKIEHNGYTGFETEPSVRFAFKPVREQTVWAAVSRAVRTPARSDLTQNANVAVIAPGATTPEVAIYSIGNPHLASEELLSYELGYRVEIGHSLSLDVATFRDHYNRIILETAVTPQFVFIPPSGPGYLRIGAENSNSGRVDSYGAEVAARWSVTAHWRLAASYSWLDSHANSDVTYLAGSPPQQAQLNSTVMLPRNAEFTAAVFYVDRFQSPYGAGLDSIPAEIRLDLGMSLHLAKGVDVGIWGKNLAKDRHLEFTSYTTDAITEIPRSVLARITWTW